MIFNNLESHNTNSNLEKLFQHLQLTHKNNYTLKLFHLLFISLNHLKPLFFCTPKGTITQKDKNPMPEKQPITHKSRNKSQQPETILTNVVKTKIFSQNIIINKYQKVGSPHNKLPLRTIFLYLFRQVHQPITTTNREKNSQSTE